ncbi:FbpB family small basic protein [Virgibacillus profundi]|nr:FbpB family small basic protein [Virgibacillus profundi]PXY53524.1 FbpB family small basic protein [Virgibacillus profundi]
MRPKSNFERLVQQNREELLEDKKRLSQLELQIEKKHEILATKNRVN